MDISQFKLKPRHRWFSQVAPDADEGWYGPHKTIEDAFIECLSNRESDPTIVYIGQGHKMTKQECDDWGVDFSWEVDTRNLIKVQECKMV